MEIIDTATSNLILVYLALQDQPQINLDRKSGVADYAAMDDEVGRLEFEFE